MRALLQKDLRNAFNSVGPALIFGIPTLLLMQFATETRQTVPIAAAYWVVFFLGVSSLFFRSFGFENRCKNFQVYSSLNISPLKVWGSQACVHFVCLLFVSACYLFFTNLLWSPENFMFWNYFEISALAAACLCPLGTLLGLLLQRERELLFSLVFFPLSCPVILAAATMSYEGFSNLWLKVFFSFFLVASCVSAFLFDHFFPEFSQN